MLPCFSNVVLRKGEAAGFEVVVGEVEEHFAVGDVEDFVEVGLGFGETALVAVEGGAGEAVRVRFGPCKQRFIFRFPVFAEVSRHSRFLYG